LRVKEQVETESGVKEWSTRKLNMFGATVIHDRHSLDDLAAESRVIVIGTEFREGNFIDPPDKLGLPKFGLGDIPGAFISKGRASDTWKPLMMIASGLDDFEWLEWASQRIEEATDELKDGHMYEEQQAIFAQVIKAYCDNSGSGLVVKEDEGLILQSSVVEPLKKELPYISPRTVAKVLTGIGLKVIRHGGTNKLFTTGERLKRVAKDIGYKDEVLN
jgi:hypothetical protein